MIQTESRLVVTDNSLEQKKFFV